MGLRTHVVVIHSGTTCTTATPHAPRNESKTAEKNGTTDTSNDTSNNLLTRSGKTAATATAAAVVVQRRRDGCSCIASS